MRFLGHCDPFLFQLIDKELSGDQGCLTHISMREGEPGKIIGGKFAIKPSQKKNWSNMETIGRSVPHISMREGEREPGKIIGG